MTRKKKISLLLLSLTTALIFGKLYQDRVEKQKYCTVFIDLSKPQPSQPDLKNLPNSVSFQIFSSLLKKHDPCLERIVAIQNAKEKPPKSFRKKNQIRIGYMHVPVSSLSAKQLSKIKNSYDALAVPLNFLKGYENTQLPLFAIDASEELYQSFLCPKKVFLCNHNEVGPGYLLTNSRPLYQKYQTVVAPHSSPNQQPSPISNFLKQIDVKSLDSGVLAIDCVYVINLDERPHRWEEVKKRFDAQGIFVNRVSAVNGWNISFANQVQLTDPCAQLLSKGALGCLLSHVSIYQDAVNRQFTTVWICEDDIEFKQNKETLSALIQELDLIDPEWDILYTDYCTKGVHIQTHRPWQPDYPTAHVSVSKNLMKTHGRYNTHSMIFSKRGLIKALRYFSSVLVYSPIDVDIHNIPGLSEYTVKQDVVSSIYDSSILATDGSSDTQQISSLNPQRE